ncbi:hypothetical protein KFE25_008430 [Diacronema lutheri]|uniref:Cyclin N-terminal domain-containing protein n=1 Tax=Diacronema lutheri TaxID=2081491 RepID=A0A8J6C8N4_DIALT|nr:hypothetical protein KFE25_008430 [Diacronema lutheri]
MADDGGESGNGGVAADARRLRRVALRLRLGQAVLGTALTFFHRCRAQWWRAGEAPAPGRTRALALACLFLAAKVEENPQRMRDVLNVAFAIDHGRLLQDSHEYWQLKEQLVRDEQLVLRDIGFDLAAPRVHRALLSCAHALSLPPAVVQLASDAANDSFVEPLALRFSDDVLAASAIAIGHAAARTVGGLTTAPLHAGWWEAVAVSSDELRCCLAELLPLCDLVDAPAREGPGVAADSVARAVDVVCSAGVFAGAPLAADEAPGVGCGAAGGAARAQMPCVGPDLASAADAARGRAAGCG